MDKKPFIIAIVLVLAAALGSVLVFKALQPAGPIVPKAAASGSYQNPDSSVRLYQNLTNSLSLLVNQDKTKLSANELSRLQSGVLENVRPNDSAGAINHFYTATGTSHPYAAYGLRQTVSGKTLAKGIGQYLRELAETTNRLPQNAELKLNSQNDQAENFVPHQTGQTLLQNSSLQSMNKAIFNSNPGANPVQLTVHIMEPAIVLSDLNSLGIKELISQGVSDFSGSSASRIHNIRVGASRYDGLIIRPGEEFSFNQHLGPVDGVHGFLPELVIKAEGTVPEFGGGLCQVSSTAFRAAFFGGLPITQRKNHSYAVSYYRWISDDLPPSDGLDATIYPGVVDLKFKNDTPAAILVDTHVEGRRLYFDFYGSPDNRQIAVDGPITYDRRASGALKAEVSRTVVLGGVETEQTFYSNYVSPNLYPRTYEYAKNEESDKDEQQTEPTQADEQNL